VGFFCLRFSPKETLKRAWWEAAIGTLRTLRNL
jgi:hypothetical protein